MNVDEYKWTEIDAKRCIEYEWKLNFWHFSGSRFCLGTLWLWVWTQSSTSTSSTQSRRCAALMTSGFCWSVCISISIRICIRIFLCLLQSYIRVLWHNWQLQIQSLENISLLRPAINCLKISTNTNILRCLAALAALYLTLVSGWVTGDWVPL